MKMILKNENCRKSASKVLDFITPFVKENTTTLKLDQLCHNYIISNNAIPAP